jgi:YD repeat-containing protein
MLAIVKSHRRFPDDELVSSQTPLQIAANQCTTYTWERGRQLKSRVVPGTGTLGERLDYTYNDLGQVTSAPSADGAGANGNKLP